MKKIKHIANNQIVLCDYIEYGNIKYEFYSYGTLIATYYSDYKGKQKIILTEYYDYSKTTSKYLKIFLNEYCNFYYDNTNELRKMIQKGGCDNVNIQVVNEC